MSSPVCFQVLDLRFGEVVWAGIPLLDGKSVPLEGSASGDQTLTKRTSHAPPQLWQEALLFVQRAKSKASCLSLEL